MSQYVMYWKVFWTAFLLYIACNMQDMEPIFPVFSHQMYSITKDAN